MDGDRTVIKCADCGNTFSITAEEKKWYEEKGFQIPKRCKKCRALKRERNNAKK